LADEWSQIHKKPKYDFATGKREGNDMSRSESDANRELAETKKHRFDTWMMGDEERRKNLEIPPPPKANLIEIMWVMFGVAIATVLVKYFGPAADAFFKGLFS
jgi:hypothetical protein